jgi:hypothetical protein
LDNVRSRKITAVAPDVCNGSFPDIVIRFIDVRFAPESGHPSAPQPNVRRVAIFRNRLQASGSAVLTPALQSAAHAVGVTLILIDMQAPGDVDPAFQTIASQAADGFIALPDPVITMNRKRIIELGIQHKLPSVCYYRYFAQSGGLIAYGPDSIDIFRRSADYVDRNAPRLPRSHRSGTCAP